METHLKTNLLNYLRTHHTGYANRTTFGLLKDIFYLKDDRRLREYTKELVHEGHRIVTCPEGVYFAESDKDIIASRRSLEKRLFAISRDLKDYDNLLRWKQMVMWE